MRGLESKWERLATLSGAEPNTVNIKPILRTRINTADYKCYCRSNYLPEGRMLGSYTNLGFHDL